MIQSSPFKFLDAFEKKDGKNFHGRKDEVEALYGMAYESNLILVYGRSGTGKTSLIQCGLANRFKSADWMDIYVRRKKNINESLKEALIARLPKEQVQEDDLLMEYLDELADDNQGTSASDAGDVNTDDVISVLTHLNERYFKPIYLIFDQFEELFILGEENSRQEQREFYRTLKRIKSQCSFCHVILSLREEWIAELSNLEKVLPDLFNKRLRVETFTRAKAINVVERTCSDFNIHLDGKLVYDKDGKRLAKGDNRAAALIVDEISKGRTELTYLQVFLDALWRNTNHDAGGHVNFSIDEIKSLGGIEDVLADFLETQSERIQSELESKFTSVEPRALRNILGGFVSVENTKQPRTVKDFDSVPPDQLEFCLRELEQARIIRYDNEAYYELSHDALAAKIAEDRDPEEIAYLELVRLVKNGYSSYLDSPDVSLTKGQLARFDEQKERVTQRNDLTSEELDFVRTSRRRQNRAQRRRLIAAGAFVGLALIASIVTLVLYFRANQANYNRFVEVGNRAYQAGNYTEAIDAFDQALAINSVDSINEKKALADELAADKIDLDSLIVRGDGLSELDPNISYLTMCVRLLDARDTYLEADQLRKNQNDQIRLNQRREAVEAELKYRRRDLETKADVMEDAKSQESMEEARRLQQVIEEINKSLGDDE